MAASIAFECMNKDANIVDKSVKLSLVELVIGSSMHALHLPFGGQLLSLNQGFMLSRFLKDFDSRIAASKMIMEVSSVASLMKALAPVGKKLGPMISISTQGFLYMLGILAFGRNLLGQMVGMVLLSPWAFIQPLVTYYIIYGHDLTSALKYFSDKHESIFHILYYVIAFKALLAALIPLVIRFVSEEKIQLLENKIEKMAVPKKRKNTGHSPVRAALNELFRPMFIISTLLMVSFFVFSGESAIEIFWKIMRAFAIAFLIFYLARNPYVHSLFARLALKNKVAARLYEIATSAAAKIEKLN